MTEAKVQINPRIPQRLVDKIDALCKERGVRISEVVTTALQQYFGELETPDDKFDVIQKQYANIVQLLNTISAGKGQSMVANTDKVEPSHNNGAPPSDWTDDGRVVVQEPTRRRRWW